ncbi:autotransporter domain-containing protein [Agrobacterium rosae]|uniref:Autotransporter domain-containing protein n=1 Tax=Agrobacterium rosae TaxID=1972867 RepID=A0AAE5RVR2_9HYPH|nr:autotransporter domain-containing protein [Agrobacterium rosae]KAA3515568.1 autotransporter domain-containing protein [Agrobacterium rosae]KAA3524532.1 autotransporter domain-containing protein [Agrobacterium rosae]MCM2431453.1 autotransporter domain-containing protein [Agrobacterium rosae]MDX8328881.1 autotransporter domain-containing protein [Agrobacterium rosae]MQB46903.1 autotransporter domain-containing protein [Agrobacterium rosae]
MLENLMMPTHGSRRVKGAASLSRGMLLASTVLLTLPPFAWAEPLFTVYDSLGNAVNTNTTAVGNGSIYVGYGSNGGLTVSDGALLSGVEGYIGQVSGVTGEVIVTGPETTWDTSGNLVVGNSGDGSLKIENSGLVESQTAYIGYNADSLGAVTVLGQGSNWQNTTLYVGYSGTGTLNIKDGGVVKGLNAYVGNNADGTGNVTVSGAGSTWTNSNVLNIGGVDGTGTLNIKDGGLVENKYGYLGNNAGSAGTVTVTGTGSTWLNTLGLYTGFYGNGTLNIEDGGLVESQESYIGLFTGSVGTATVLGSGSTLTSTNLYIGNDGNGTLNIEDGGLVESTYGFIGNNIDGVGAVTVTGVGSKWQNASNIFVGKDGNGTLNIEDGGSIESRTTQIGSSTDARGKVTVTGNGSKWSDSGNIFVGYAGEGTLNVEDGGVVEDVKGFIGYNGGSKGVVTVTGDRSIWANSDKLYVGNLGDGTLMIQDGGVVSVGSLEEDGSYDGITYIAYQPGSTGILIIGAAAGDDAVAAGTLKTETIKFGQGGTGTILFNHTDTDYSFSANINGNGEIHQLSGVTTLSGDSSNFSGITNVDGGTLNVTGTLKGTLNAYDGGTIAGAGTIGSTTIEDGGILSPGGLNRIIYSRGAYSSMTVPSVIGTLTVDGDLILRDGSTYAVDLSSTTSDLTQVSGTATIEVGAGVKVTSLDSANSYTTAQKYKIISTGDGLTGTFTGLTNTASAFLDITTSYDDDNAYLNVALKSSGGNSGGGSGVFEPVANTTNQHSVASALDTLDQTDSASLDLRSKLLLLSADEARQTYQQLSGDVYATAQGAFVQTNRAVNTALNSRVRAVTDGVAAPSSMALGYAEEKETPKNEQFSAFEPKKSFDPDRFATWINGFGSWGKVSGVDGESDTDISNGGVLVGGDVAVGNDWRVGVLGGYSRSFFDTDSSSGSSTNYHLGAYSGTKWGPVAVRSGVNYTWHNVDTTRNVNALGQTLSGDYDASSLNAYGELAYRLNLGKSALEPFAALAHSRTKTDGFSETGGTAALTVDSSSMNTTFTTIGLRTSTDFDLAGVASVARGTIGWMHAYGDVDPVSSARFLTGDSFAISSTPIDRNAALLEAGVDLTITPASTLSFTYNGQIGSNAYDHGANAKLRVKF